ncbi:hypothetical protein D3C80_2036630 [compost metagenome]
MGSWGSVVVFFCAPSIEGAIFLRETAAFVFSAAPPVLSVESLRCATPNLSLRVFPAELVLHL